MNYSHQFNRFCSEIHQHDIANSSPLVSCSDLKSQSFKLPSINKTSVLSPTDYQHLKATYATLFDHEILDIQMTRSIKIYKKYYSLRTIYRVYQAPTNKTLSLYLLAAWTDSNGNISEDKIRPRKVLYFLSHKIKEDDHFVEHLFALVAWFDEHPYQFHYGKPLEVWKTNIRWTLFIFTCKQNNIKMSHMLWETYLP